MMTREQASLIPSIVFAGRTYFTTAELGCRCDFCKGKGQFASGFAEDLLGLRLALGFALPLSSGCRCLEHNEDSGGSDGSYHIYENDVGTCAVDVSLAKWDSVKRARIIEVALMLGWRVGVHDAFVHLDRSPVYYPEEEKKLFLY